MDSFILTGRRGQGKTTVVLDSVNVLTRMGMVVSGIAAPVVYTEKRRIGYDIIDLSSGVRVPWLRIRNNEFSADIGSFFIQSSGLDIARNALRNALAVTEGMVFVDEIGPLEFRNGGHAWFMERFHECSADMVIMTARPSLAAGINTRWQTGSGILPIEEIESVHGLLGILGG